MRKRVLLFFLIAIFMIAMSFSASITVTNPHTGVCWEKGKTYIITWTKSGSMDSNVKIRLYQGSVKILAVTDSTPNDGSFTWTIPNSVVNGTYVIRVKTLDNSVYDNSGSLTINDSCSVETIIINPDKFLAIDPLWWLHKHGPGPVSINLIKLKNILEEQRIKQSVSIMLYSGRTLLVNIGTFNPVVNGRVVMFDSMRSNHPLKLNKRQEEILKTKGARLVVRSGRTVLYDKIVKLQTSGQSGYVTANRVNPAIIKNARIIKGCPDLAVIGIDMEVIRKYTRFTGRVRITGIVKNVGSADYISYPNRQMIVMDIGDAAHPLVTKPFQNLKVGQIIKIVYETDWNSSSPNEGEFPPTFRVYLTFDPDINMDNLKTNDDCNPNNNKKTKSSVTINELLR